MSKCIKCGVDVLDQSERCPLCQHVLEHGGLEQTPAYPNARVYVRKFRFFENLLLFLSLVAESVLVFINIMVDPQFLWSMIVGLILIYVNVTIRLAVLGRSGYQFKTISMVVIAMVILTGIDYLTGYRGWAVNYVLPGGILFMDAAILIVMMINFRNWQSYMMVQILTILLSVVPVVMLAVGMGDFPYLAIGAMGASIFLFLGTLIMGDQRARNELKRRFHL